MFKHWFNSTNSDLWIKQNELEMLTKNRNDKQSVIPSA